MKQDEADTKQPSRVVRVSAGNYANLKKLRALYGKRHGITKATYDIVLGQALQVALALIEGDEVYEVAGRVFDDLAEARGEAILLAARAGRKPKMPHVLVRLGEDEGP